MVVSGEGGRRAEHAWYQVWAQVGAVGGTGHCHPVQGAGTAREGQVHTSVCQVLCGQAVGVAVGSLRWPVSPNPKNLDQFSWALLRLRANVPGNVHGPCMQPPQTWSPTDSILESSSWRK